MPAPSRWMIRCSLVYLLLGFSLGCLLLIHKAYPLHPAIWMLMPVHIEMMIFGWVIHITLGTAYWILPRFLTGPSRGSDLMAYVMVVLLNAGIVLVILHNLNPGTIDLPLSLVGRIFETGAVILFAILHWDRITTYRN